MGYELFDTDSYITWPYQIAGHYCRITWVYNKYGDLPHIINIKNQTQSSFLSIRILFVCWTE